MSESGSGKFEYVLYDVREGVATVTLNRPDRLNAYVPQMGEDEVAAARKGVAGLDATLGDEEAHARYEQAQHRIDHAACGRLLVCAVLCCALLS